MNKKIFGIGFAAMVIAAVAMLNSCEKSAVSRLKMLVYEAQKECPYSDQGFVVESMEYVEDSNTVKVTYKIPLELEGEYLTYYNEHPDVLRNIFINGFLGTGEGHELIDPIVEADAALQCDFYFQGEVKPLVVKLTAQELKDMNNSDKNTLQAKEDLLKLQVQVSNVGLPQEENGVRVEKVDYDGNDVIYHVTLDETQIPLSVFQDSQDEFKQMMLEDESISDLVDVVAPLGKGIKYLITGSKSGKTVDLTITEEDYNSGVRELDF